MPTVTFSELLASLSDASPVSGDKVAGYDGADAVVFETDDLAGGAVAAADVSYAGGSGMSATDVEAAIDELATEKLSLVAGGASVENIGAVESNVNTVATSGSTETLDTATYGV